MLRASLLLLAVSALAPGQTTRFEVASIKLNDTGSGASGDDMSHGRLTVKNETLKQVIQMAFGVKDFQIAGGPGWVSTERFDIAATTGNTDSMTDEQWGVLLQSLLADRFGLKVHRETKEATIYSLVVAKGGPKMAVDTDEGGPSANSYSRNGRVTMMVKKTTAAQLASRLERYIGRRVTDNTGLAARYDFTLSWTSSDAKQDPSADNAPPSIFTALPEQLGLRLEAAKGPVEMIAIDAVDRPSEN